MNLRLCYLLMLPLPMFLLSQGCHLPSKTKRPPNIIIIFTDDQGYHDVGCFGAQDFETPNLDQMAREGIRLTNFYVAQPVCSASRAALLTGCYPSRVNIHHALMPRSAKGLNPDETTLPEMLKTKGYATAIYGKWHLGDHPDFMPLRQGFDEYFGIPYSNDMWPIHPNPGMRKNFPWLPLYEGEIAIDSLHDQTNELQAIRSGPWKMYFPHTYRSMEGQPAGHDGQPGPYKGVKITAPELFNLDTDIEETRNVAAEFPAIVKKLEALADKAREELGDALTDHPGAAVRPAGKADWD